MTIIEANNIQKRYSVNTPEERPVLFGVNLTVQQGECVGLVGPSGAGKSTLLHIMGLLDKADSGDIIFYEDELAVRFSELSDSKATMLRSKKFGFVFQFHHLLQEFTAVENVELPALLAGAPKKQAREKASQLLERVQLFGKHNRLPSELSGGEQQRVAIARALVNNPQVLFADEPTGNLDSATTASVLRLLHDCISSDNLTCIIATHSIDVASFANRIETMRDGVLVA